MVEKTYFLRNHKYSVFKKVNTYYIYIYNNYFFFIIKLNIQIHLKIVSNKEFKIVQNPFDRKGQNYFNNLTQFIEQFDKYVFTKIRFAGKGYKIRKKSVHSMILIFNRAHITVIWWRNIILKKIKKNKFYVKLTPKTLNFINTILKVRHINIFTKKGLRTSRQILFKKKGKKT